MNCRLCDAALDDIFIDLGSAPPSNAFVTADRRDQPETRYPLKLFACRDCGLVQLPAHQDPAALFTSDYVYFSSFSASWLAHAERYVAQAVERLGLDARSQVVEIASNDGYLLQYVKARGIRCYGVEPTAGTAAAARARGIDSVQQFFGESLARELLATRGPADLIVANNVFAHVPDLNDFSAGLAGLLAPGGTLTLEFPHLLELVRHNQFDTIYHEHYSYFSLAAARRALARHGLAVWDVEQLPTRRIRAWRNCWPSRLRPRSTRRPRSARSSGAPTRRATRCSPSSTRPGPAACASPATAPPPRATRC
jgi:trans-aconitate methyltransferase